MSKRNRQRYTRAEKRAIANKPHPEETSEPIKQEKEENLHISVWKPMEGFEEFPTPLNANKKTCVLRPLPNFNRSKKYVMEGDEKLVNDHCTIRNMLN